MDTELHYIKQEVVGESQGVKLQNDRSHLTNSHFHIKEEPEEKQISFNAYYHSQNITSLQQNVETKLQDMTQGVQIQKVKIENDSCLEIIDSQGYDKIYVFENKYSDCDENDYGNESILEQSTGIKLDIQSHLQGVKHVPVEDTDFTTNTKNSHVENSDIKFESGFSPGRTDSIRETRLEHGNGWQPTVVLKREPDTIFEDEYQVFPIPQNGCCDKEKGFSGEQHTCSEDSQRYIACNSAEQVHMGIQSHICSQCMTKFETANLLSSHICPGFPGADKAFICAKRDDKSTDSGSELLIVNQPTASNGHLNTNNMCSNGFKIVGILTLPQTSRSPEQPHQCNVCGKIFKIFYHLRRHMISHSTERPHQCNVCDKTYKTLASLRNHISCHNTERPHECKLCGKAFKTISHVKEHILTHSTERPHQCGVCGKSFKTLHNLNVHDKTVHNFVRPHQCSICDKSFKRKGHLTKHILRHKT